MHASTVSSKHTVLMPQGTQPMRTSSRRSTVAMAGSKKACFSSTAKMKAMMNSYDEEWEKGFFGTGLFLEDREESGKSAFKKIEEKKLLSTVEKAGLLSKLEKAGITLSKIEKLGLLSTAEKLGLLSVAEDVLTGNPATLAAGALPFVVLAVMSASLIPHDNGIESALSYGLALTFTGVAGALLAGGFIVAGLQEE